MNNISALNLTRHRSCRGIIQLKRKKAGRTKASGPIFRRNEVHQSYFVCDVAILTGDRELLTLI